MDMHLLYSLISMFAHHPIGVAPVLKPPVGHLVIE